MDLKVSSKTAKMLNELSEFYLDSEMEKIRDLVGLQVIIEAALLGIGPDEEEALHNLTAIVVELTVPYFYETAKENCRHLGGGEQLMVCPRSPYEIYCDLWKKYNSK